MKAGAIDACAKVVEYGYVHGVLKGDPGHFAFDPDDVTQRRIDTVQTDGHPVPDTRKA